MADIPDLGPVPTRMAVDAELVQSMVARQFPQWASLLVTPVANGGWDNWTFRLGSDLVVRLPSASEYALAVGKEHLWLPMLASHLPVPIPVPVVQGVPSEQYPYPWSIYQWLPGEPAAADRIQYPIEFAVDLADFLRALWQIDAQGGPEPGIHNWFRGGSLRTFDMSTRRALAGLGACVDVGLAAVVWAEALDSRWDGVDHWFHGDLAQGNILLDNGHLAAVIDFGTCGVGDPSCDLAIAWTLLTADGRRAFRERLGVDDGMWSRGRGWALWKALATCLNTYERPDVSDEFEAARSVLVGICEERNG